MSDPLRGFHREEDGYYLRLFGLYVTLKTPHHRAYFSERYGYHPPTFTLAGYRVWMGKLRTL